MLFSFRLASSPGVHKKLPIILFIFPLSVVFTTWHMLSPFLFFLRWPPVSQSGSLDLPSPPQISCVCSYTPLNFHERLRRPRSQGPSCVICSLIFRLSSAFCFRSQLLFVLKIRTGCLNVDTMDKKKNDEKLQQWAWVLLVNSLNAEANYEWERNQQKNNTGKQNLYHSPVFLENSHRSRCRYDACVNKIKRKVRITTVSEPVRWENRWNWQRRTLCFASPSVSSVILIATLRCDRSSNSKWHLTAQHNIAGFLLLPLTTSVSFPFFLLFLWEFTMQTDTHSGSALPALWNKGLIGWCQAVVPLLSLNQSFQQLLSL